MADDPSEQRSRGRVSLRFPLHSIERRVRAELARGEAATASATAVAFFGPDIYGFVTAALAGVRGVLDVYASFVAELPRALREFGWRCELRVFLYHLARVALRRHREGEIGEAGPRATPPAPGQPPPTAGLLRIPPYRRTRRLAVATLRSAIAPDDREVLVLRVDRRLRWHELAVTSLGERASEPTLRAEARRLRERFHAIRRQMKQLTNDTRGADAAGGG